MTYIINNLSSPQVYPIKNDIKDKNELHRITKLLEENASQEILKVNEVTNEALKAINKISNEKIKILAFLKIYDLYMNGTPSHAHLHEAYNVIQKMPECINKDIALSVISRKFLPIRFSSYGCPECLEDCDELAFIVAKEINDKKIKSHVLYDICNIKLKSGYVSSTFSIAEEIPNKVMKLKAFTKIKEISDKNKEKMQQERQARIGVSSNINLAFRFAM